MAAETSIPSGYNFLYRPQSARRADLCYMEVSRRIPGRKGERESVTVRTTLKAKINSAASYAVVRITLHEIRRARERGRARDKCVEIGRALRGDQFLFFPGYG